MTRETAATEAAEIASNEGIRMVVTFNPYAEETEETERYGYFPAVAIGIFSHEEVVETIEATS